MEKKIFYDLVYEVNTNTKLNEIDSYELVRKLEPIIDRYFRDFYFELEDKIKILTRDVDEWRRSQKLWGILDVEFVNDYYLDLV